MKKIVVLTFATMMIPAVLFVFVGCIKKPEVSKDFGPEVTATDVVKTLMSAPSADVESIKKGEFSYLERTLRIEGGSPEITRQTADTVIQKIDKPDEFTVTINRQLVEFQNGEAKPSKTQFDATVQKRKMTDISPTNFLSLGTITAKAGPKVTFHNLKKTEDTASLPLLVQLRSNCGGIPADKCAKPIRVTRVTFDQVVWDGEEADKATFQYVFSPDVPFLATGAYPDFFSVISYCMQTLLPVSGQRVGVLQCDDVKDFSFGQ